MAWSSTPRRPDVALETKERPRITLGYTMELLVAAALAIAAVRVIHQHTPPLAGPGMPVSIFRPELAWTQLLDSAIWMFGLFEGSVLVVRWIARREPGPWGIGRWTWAVVFLERPASSILDYPRFLANYLRFGGFDGIRAAHEAFLLGRVRGLAPTIAPFLVATYVAFAMGRRGDTVPVDDREWGGRAYAAVVIVWAIAFRVLYILR